MNRVALIALVLLAVPLTGCVDGDDVDGDEVAVAWVEQPQDMDTGEAIDVSWELTGPEGQVPHTGLHWGTDSVDDPSSPADYGNTPHAVEPADAPGTFQTSVTFDEEGTYYFRAHVVLPDGGGQLWTEEVEITVSQGGLGDTPVIITIDEADQGGETGENMTVNWSLTGTANEVQHTGFHWADFSVEDPSSPADYGNSSGVVEPAGVGHSYNATFSEAEPGTYHGRAHVIHDGQHYWSEELEFNVTGTETGENGTEHLVEISDESALGATSSFDPAELTVAPGDTVVWNNTGQASHSVVFENESLEGSEAIEPGANFTWTVPADLAPGDYAYNDGEASVDAGSGTITVEAADGS